MLGFKTILLPFNNTQPSETIVDTAHLIGARFSSYIEGVHYRQVLPIIAGEGITLPGDYMTGFEEEAQRQAKIAEQTFSRMIEERNISFGTFGHVSETMRVGWRSVVGVDALSVGEYARLFDLSIVERQPAGSAVNWKVTAEAILFESGRPVILTNNIAPEHIGHRIVIAWNGSTEAARSVSAAMPFLEHSEEIIVLSVHGGTVSGPDGAQLSNSLSARGLMTKHETIDPRDGNIGRAIIKFARDCDCDLLVKGAYTQSRLRQLVFGGATREIIEHSPIPTLFSH